MSKERFAWLKKIGAEVIATPGTESNVKEIYDKCNELKKDPNNIIFNQFDEFANPIFHYNVTGSAILEVFAKEILANNKKARLAAYISATGSAGTIGAGDNLKKHYPHCKTVAAEAWQCPTILMNGFGEHRIEGIGDKHIPWVHNVRNTDAVSAIDDEDCMRIMRLFNTQEGAEFLQSQGIDAKTFQQLSLLGISGICNLLSCIKTAKFFELSEDDVIFTIFTDSMAMYGSRLAEENEIKGKYNLQQAGKDFSACLVHQNVEHYKQLDYYDRKAVHNLKYFTWVEQQGKNSEELNEQWNPEYWRSYFEDEIDYFDELITEFNKEVGL
jgi:cysteine synthase